MPRTVIISSQEPDRQPDSLPDSTQTSRQSDAILTISQATSLAAGYTRQIQEDSRYHEDNPQAREYLSDLVRRVIGQPRQSGSPDDYHNLAVELCKTDDNLACDILDLALKRYESNTDLLADYLIYGIDCDRFDRCRDCAARLNAIPRRDWTWRGFQFQIIYLNRLLDRGVSPQERSSIKKSISRIAQAYRQYLPHSEGGYRALAQIYNYDQEKELRHLNEALADPDFPCPACAIKCADILFDQKQYRKALEYIDRCRRDVVHQRQGGIDEYMVSFLAGLCKIALHMDEKTEFTTEEVLDIYGELDTALLGVSADMQATIRDRALFLQRQTKVLIEEQDGLDELKNLVSR